MKLFNAVAIAIALGLTVTTPASAVPNLILNGSFETPDVSPGALGPIGGWQAFYLPTPGLEWTPVTPNGMEIQDHVVGEPGQAWEAYRGDQLAELDVYANGGMYQTINTISGHRYNLSFALSPRPGVDPSSSGIQLYWNDALVDTVFTDGVGLVNTDWSLKHYVLTATGTSSTIKFMATGISDGLGSLIDDVRLVPPVRVPEPSTLFLLGCGLVGLVGFGRKKTKK